MCRLRIVTLSLFLSFVGYGFLGAAPSAVTTDIEVYFSPKGGCTAAIVKEIDAAKSSLAVQAYTFTSTPIAQAIARAHHRGIKVIVILDKAQETENSTEAIYLVDHRVPTYLDGKHTIAHNKVMVIDQQTVITGSFNFTKGAEDYNAENLLVIHRPELAAKYLDNFAEHLKHSEVYRH